MTVQNRVQRGVPTGGEYAATVHGESEVALAPVRRPELAGWPENLPEPEVTLNLNEDGSIATQVNVAGELAFAAWTDEDDPGSAESGGWANDAIPDEHTSEQAEAWIRAKHLEMAAQMRWELKDAFDRARAGIVAEATGKPEPLGEDGLKAVIDANNKARNAAERDVELASASLTAQKVLATHPDARYAEMITDSYDNGEFVIGFRVFDVDGNQLHEYREDEGTAEERDIVDIFQNLSPEPAKSHWSGAFVTGAHQGSIYNAIDLRKAAAWTPGARP